MVLPKRDTSLGCRQFFFLKKKDFKSFSRSNDKSTNLWTGDTTSPVADLQTVGVSTVRLNGIVVHMLQGRGIAEYLQPVTDHDVPQDFAYR